MPTYEYLFKDCRDLFEKTLTLTAHAREPSTCPKCGGKNVERNSRLLLRYIEEKCLRSLGAFRTSLCELGHCPLQNSGACSPQRDQVHRR